jgi:hypothetical protein
MFLVPCTGSVSKNTLLAEHYKLNRSISHIVMEESYTTLCFMCRFNGYDRRMDRVMECSLLVMESFKGFEDIFQYEIVGHSGDDFKLPIVGLKEVPKDNKERLDLLRIMHLHAQFCSSGDNTLEATQEAIKTLGAEIDDYDESFVIVLSDANLERYGIDPKQLAKILNSNPEVKAFSVFIGSLGDQAQRYILLITVPCQVTRHLVYHSFNFV